jgi:hypothetical protein
MLENGRNDWMRTIALVAALVALVGLMFAYTRPMDQRICSLESQVAGVQRLIESRLDKVEQRVLQDLASVRETALTGEEKLQSRVERLEEWRVTYNDSVPAINASQDKRLEAIERIVFKQTP